MLRISPEQDRKNSTMALNPLVKAGNPYLIILHGAARFLNHKGTRYSVTYPENVWRNEW